MAHINKALASLVSLTITTGCALSLGVMPANAAKVTIRFCSYQTGVVIETWKKQFAEYEKLTGVKVIHEIVPWGETLSRHLTYMAGGVSRDCAMITAAYERALAANGLLVDLQSLAGRLDPTYNFEDFWPKLFDVYKYKGRPYAMPSDLDLGLLWYNRSLFDQAGLPYPSKAWDWDSYLEAAVKLTKTVGGKKVQFGTTFAPWEIFLWQNGASVLSSDASQCTIDSPEAEKALQFVTDLSLKHGVVGSGFETGKIGVHMGEGPYYAWYGLNKVKFPWGAAPMPKGKLRATTAWGSSFGIFKGSKHIPETWRFLKWFLSPEKQAQRAKDWSWFPPGKEATQIEGFMTSNSMSLSPAQKEMVMESVAYGKAPTIIRRQDDLNTILNQELSKVWSGKLTVRQATGNIKKRVGPLLK